MYGTTSAEIIIFKKRNKLNSHIFGEPSILNQIFDLLV